MGVAGAFALLDLTRVELLAALAAFNVGEAFGELTVIAAAALLVRAVVVPAAQCRRPIVWPASAAIALTGIFWTTECLE